MRHVKDLELNHAVNDMAESEQLAAVESADLLRSMLENTLNPPVIGQPFRVYPNPSNSAVSTSRIMRLLSRFDKAQIKKIVSLIFSSCCNEPVYKYFEKAVRNSLRVKTGCVRSPEYPDWMNEMLDTLETLLFDGIESVEHVSDYDRLDEYDQKAIALVFYAFWLSQIDTIHMPATVYQ